MCTIQDMMINKKDTCYSTRKPLTMHENSRIITKLVKPKIRIFHVYAPEIIKTDVAHFRELVQRLTGKPIENEKLKARKKYHKRSRFSNDGSEVREKIKGEDDIWVGANSGGGFLGGFGDLDGFMQELNHDHDHVFAPALPNRDTPTLEFSGVERSINFPSNV